MYCKIVKFRLSPTGTITEVGKPYLQIAVDHCHHDLIKYLWLNNIFKDIPDVVRLWFCWVFWSKLLVIFINVNYHDSQHKDTDKDFADKFTKRFYIDAFNSTDENVTEREQLYKKIKERFSGASCKWKTALN